MTKKKSNKKYKDGFFRHFLGTEENANARFLDVMNATFGTNLTLETAKIEDINLENVFYTRLRNDVAKIVNGRLVVLFEHQSTVNENLPLRMLEYVTMTYISILNAKDRYKTALQKIPRPLFVVFYNGKQNFPEEKILRLSDAFLDDGVNEVMLELTVRMININLEKNSPILQKSKTLHDYSSLCYFIEKCKEQGKSDFVKAGILLAIKNGVLVEYLEKNIMEADNMFFPEYDYDMDIAVKTEEAEERGMQQGCISTAKKLFLKGVDEKMILDCTGITEEQFQKIKDECCVTA